MNDCRRNIIGQGKFSWEAIVQGAAIGSTVGLTGGAGLAYGVTGSALASTGAVASGLGFGAATVGPDGAPGFEQARQLLQSQQMRAGVGAGNYETYYRTMSKADYETLLSTGKIPATGETFISPTQSFSQGYDGVIIEFQVKAGTTNALESIGLRDVSNLTSAQYPNMPGVLSGWGSNNALFKGEGIQINIGLGKGSALDIFNNNITGFKVVGGK
ncbi:hypothetical protein [Lacrimispora sp.]|uniref:hypothetical protein n=1 Tax=Lacrimispora sp. TaxID=2719234 RepID=UPI00289B2505|nr:hypothetical protein [Lacrimispora sp.]